MPITMPLLGERTIRILLTLLVLVCAAVLATSVTFYVLVLFSDFLWIALGSVLIIHLTVRPSLSEAALVLSSAMLSCAFDFYTLALPFRAKSIPAFLGLSSLAILAVRIVWARGHERKLLAWAFLPAISFVGAGWMTGPILRFTEAQQVRVLDLFLYSYDCSLRIQPSFLLGLAYLKWPWFKTLGLAAYLGMPIPVALVYAQQLKRKGEKALPIFLAFFYCGPVGAIFYNVFPAIGPRQLFLGDFPLHPHAIAEVMHLHVQPIVMQGVRNAMPSLHMAWVLLAWWYSRGAASWVRATVFVFLAFTVMSTMGTGEHYLIDLIVALPFALLVRALFSLDLSWKNGSRVATFSIGLFGITAWFCLLRFATSFFWLSPLIPWTLAIMTVGGTIVQQSRLERAEAAIDTPSLQHVTATLGSPIPLQSAARAR